MAADYIDFWFTMGSTYSYLSVVKDADGERSAHFYFPNGLNFDQQTSNHIVIGLWI